MSAGNRECGLYKSIFLFNKWLQHLGGLQHRYLFSSLIVCWSVEVALLWAWGWSSSLLPLLPSWTQARVAEAVQRQLFSQGVNEMTEDTFQVSACNLSTHSPLVAVSYVVQLYIHELGRCTLPTHSGRRAVNSLDNPEYSEVLWRSWSEGPQFRFVLSVVVTISKCNWLEKHCQLEA